MPDRRIAGNALSPDAARALTEGPAHHFVGAGDRQPWSPSGRYLLGIEIPPELRSPPGAAVVGVVDLKNGSAWRPLAATIAWNWRDGAMAQWIPGNEDVMVGNTNRKGKPGSFVFDVGRGARRFLPHPVYCVSPIGAKAFSVDFGRLGFYRRGHGYERIPAPGPFPPAPANDGVWSVNLARGDRRLTISYADLRKWTATGEADILGTWADRLQVNREGTRLGFLHHTLFEKGGAHTHLITCSMSGGGLYCVTKGFVGDFAWGPGGKIVAWCGPRAGSAATRRSAGGRLELVLGISRILGEPDWFQQQVVHPFCRNALGRRYRVFRDEEGEIPTPLEDDALSAGRPAFSPDGRLVLTETGPDARHLKTVCLLYPPSGRVTRLARFGSPQSLNDEARCHLYPRWRPDMKALALDSCHDGRRQICEVAIPDSALDPARPRQDPLESVLAR
ncbi:MAG: hypothetical protein QME60_07810 [Verrucomicrobiota bacterium]|nr:hypothetical protein [Verrucomicrobiota bacterium]